MIEEEIKVDFTSPLSSTLYIFTSLEVGTMFFELPGESGARASLRVHQLCGIEIVRGLKIQPCPHDAHKPASSPISMD